MSSENEYKKLLIIGTLIGLIGSIALILGIIFNYITTDLNVLDLAIVAWTAGIFIICLITFLGSITPTGIVFDDERPSLFSIALFILAPTLVVSQYNTPMHYLLETGSELLGAGSATFTTYLIFIGIVLLLVAFIILTWVFLWKRRATSASDLYLDETSEIGLVRFLRIITSSLVIAAGVGIILGFVIVPSTGLTASLLMSEDGSGLDFSALAFMVYIVGIIVTAVILLLGNLGKTKIPRSELPLLVLLITILALPGYSPSGVSATVWSTPVYKLLEFGKNQIGNITFIGWVLIIGVSITILAFLLLTITYFMKSSATFVERSVRTGRVRKTRVPKGPPSAQAMAPPSGTLADQLSPSGPPSAGIPTGPPGAGVSAETPTCPFCGQNLRYIDEYQRWYCDNCSQYV
ncbi:MAG: hypothetical protein FK730_13365 [Asgard group archaeon]|nr:hypothetical protein [Asgard group archaeon]